MTGKTRDPRANNPIFSRRRFLRSSAGLFAASWAAGAGRLAWAGGGGALPALPLFYPELPEPSRRGSKAWTPVNQALARFHTHRYASERRFQALADSLQALRSALLAGGVGMEACLSPRFRGVSLAPAGERVEREDSCFVVRRAEWGEGKGPALGRDEFAANLRAWLKGHAPLALAELDCTGIRESSALASSASGGRASASPAASSQNLLTHFHFQLSGAQGNAGAGVSAALARWQMSGEWEIEWEGEGAAGEWKIVGWRPLEAVTVLGAERVFTDVTKAAFGQDPSYAAHLLRDTNYWRAVLDEASGVDIFGNYGVSVGDVDGDGRDEVYLCQAQGLPNRLYRQSKPGVFEDIAPQAGVDVLDATAMALFADLLNRGRQDLILITQSAPLLFLNDGHGKFTLARNGFPPSMQQASLTGAALADYDRDGFLDLYVCSYGYFQGQGAVPLPTPYYDAQNGPGNHLYRNRGDGTFVDVTTASGLDHGNNRYSFSCAWADIDDDGWPDLCIVNDFGRNNLYRNRHDGTFEEIIDGLPGFGAGMSAAFADVDGDGLGELYAAGMWQPVGERVTADPEFEQRFADVGVGPVRQFAMGSNLYHTVGAVREPPLHQDAGAVGAVREPSLHPGPKMQALAEAAGARRAYWNWCSDVFDLANDGWPDIYCLNGYLSSPRPELAPLDSYFWEEVIALSPHAFAPSIEYRAAWAAAFELAHRGHAWDGFERNVFFLNSGAGRFVDASAVTGLNFIDDGRSFAVFDYDGDGDADLVIRNRTGPQLRLLRNEVGHRNCSLALRLRATRGNRDAIGARVEVETPSGRRVRFLSCGSGFLAQHSKELIFGLGDCSGGVKVRVRWPSGSVSEFADLAAGQRYYLVEGQQNPRGEALARAGSGEAAGPASDPPQPEPIPGRFSTALVDPLPMPSLAAMGLKEEVAGQGALAAPAAGKIKGLGRYALLWLWDAQEKQAVGAVREPPLHPDALEIASQRQDDRAPAGEDASGLETLLAVQGKIASRLVIWGSGALAPGVGKRLDYAPWRAGERFRLFITTLLDYLFDYRRQFPFPTGLLFEVGSEAAHDPAGLASFRKLVKVYWGGAEAEQILADARRGVKSGAAALPFAGRTLLCSYRRDFRWIGAALVEAGYPQAAEIYLAQLVESNPKDAEAQYNLALIRREAGQPALALAGVRAALAARPVFPEAENLLAVLLMDSGEIAEATAQLEKTTRETPDLVEAWNNLGYLMLRQNNLPEARTALERAVALAPDFPDAINNLGILSARQGDRSKAEELFRRALALQPGNEQAANNLGVLYAQQGRTQEALETFRALLQHNPEASSAVYNLAKLDISLGNASEAKSVLNSWLARHPGDANAQKLLERATESRRQ
jgi:Flp pilus assembly protein TadD